MNQTITAIIQDRRETADRKRAWLTAEPRSDRAIERNKQQIAAIEADISATEALIAGWTDEQQASAAKAFEKYGIDEFGRRQAAYFVEQGF